MLVVGYPLLSSGLCLATGIIVHHAFPAQTSLCHVQLMCTTTQRHTELGAHGLTLMPCDGRRPCRAEVSKGNGVLLALAPGSPAPQGSCGSTQHFGCSAFTTQLRLRTVLATGTLGWVALWSLAVAELAPGSAVLLGSFLLQPRCGSHSPLGAALSPAMSFSACASF